MLPSALPRRQFSLDALIAEAKRRARQRRYIVALSALLLVVLATGLTLRFRSSGGGPSSRFATTVASAHVGALAAERGAIGAAQRENDNLRIFPTRPGTKTCQLPPSGGIHALISGRCTTSVSAHGNGSRVDFIQRASVNGHVQTGDWIYYLNAHDRFVHFHPQGWLPQDEP